MASFEVKVVRIDSVENHPNADRLTINKIGGYTCISNKHEDGSPRYKAGDLVVYIPEAAVLPEWLLKRMGFWNEEKGCGMLAGKLGNRVKPMKLRGIYSEGILYPVIEERTDHQTGSYIVGEPVDDARPNTREVKIDDDVASYLGITKYEPPIPVSMAGQVFNAFGHTVKFDIEPYEKYIDLFAEGEEVVFTEKLHGTFTAIGIVPGLNHPEAFEAPWGSRDIIVYSKGLGSQGLVFKDVPENAGNLYIKAMKAMLTEQFWEGFGTNAPPIPIHFFGETFGTGVQDLNYGLKTPVFRMFDIYQDGRALSYAPFADLAQRWSIQTVPVLYRGPFDHALIPAHRDGKDSISNSHVREGIVIRPVEERRSDKIGRVLLKAVSPDYKLRKGEATEYQ